MGWDATIFPKESDSCTRWTTMIQRRSQQPEQALARAAFTLMEMLVVVAILVVLAGAAVPIYLRYLEQARKDRAKADIKNLEQTIDAFNAANGTYPDTLMILTEPQADGSKAYLDPSALLDPWNRPYHYDTTSLN